MTGRGGKVDLTPFAGDRRQFSRLGEIVRGYHQSDSDYSGVLMNNSSLKATLRGHTIANSETHSNLRPHNNYVIMHLGVSLWPS